MITVTNIKKYYTVGNTAIPATDNVSFKVSQGEFVIILGPSGSGKTTLLNLIGGMTFPAIDNIGQYQHTIAMREE